MHNTYYFTRVAQALLAMAASGASLLVLQLAMSI
jgi:hypothetical protein